MISHNGPAHRRIHSKAGLNFLIVEADGSSHYAAGWQRFHLASLRVFASLRDRILRFLADDFLVAYTLLLIACMGIGGAYAKFQFSVGA